MKKVVTIPGTLLFIVLVFLPLGTLISTCFGRSFKLADYPITAGITASLAIIEIILCLSQKVSQKVSAKEPAISGILGVMFALSTPMSLINAVLYLSGHGGIWIAACMLICTVCCFCLTIIYGDPSELKIAALILSALMALPVFCFGLISASGGIVQNTVVKVAASPDGSYRAEVIDSDQGALGGDTLVYVYENKIVDLFIFNISKKPETVYRGDWGEFESMNIYWKNGNTLVVNAVEHTIRG